MLASPPSERPLRILLVDDDAVDRLVCRRALARFQPAPEFLEADTAEEALRRSVSQPLDCVLLDFRLPDMDGLELLERLNDRAVDQRVPVVMLTGADDVTVAVEAMRRGASDYLVKDVGGQYQALISTVVLRAIRQRDLQMARWRAEQELAQQRLDLSDLTRRLMTQEKTLVRRLAQALHDQLGQTLTAIRLGFDAVASSVRDQASAPVRRQFERVDTLVDQAVREVRRVLVELRPPLLEEYGLVAALDNELRSRSVGHEDVDLRVDLRLDSPTGNGEIRWPPDVEYAAFMIAREAIANALRHAKPASITVLLEGDEDRMQMRVIDDGSGMADDSTSRPGHLGMVGMRERALAIGAQCAVHSVPGGGTTVTLSWSRNPVTIGSRAQAAGEEAR